MTQPEKRISSEEMAELVETFADERKLDEFLETNDINTRGEIGETFLGSIWDTMFRATLFDDRVQSYHDILCVRIKIIRRLLENGIDLEAKNDEGNSVMSNMFLGYMFLLKRQCHTVVLGLLLHNGVDTNIAWENFPVPIIVDKSSMTMLDEASFPRRFYELMLKNTVRPFYICYLRVEYTFMIDMTINVLA